MLAREEGRQLARPLQRVPAKTLTPSDDGLSVETDASLGDDDWLKLMEMNDNHVEFHTVKEFMTFCVAAPRPRARAPGRRPSRASTSRAAEAGGQLVDQRLLPRIDEGEVRILMAGDTCQMAIHKKPMGGGLSAVGGNSDYTYYTPEDKKYKNMIATLYKDIPTLLPAMASVASRSRSCGPATTSRKTPRAGPKPRTRRTPRPSTSLASSTARASASRCSRRCAAARRRSRTCRTPTTSRRAS